VVWRIGAILLRKGARTSKQVTSKFGLFHRDDETASGQNGVALLSIFFDRS